MPQTNGLRYGAQETQNKGEKVEKQQNTHIVWCHLTTVSVMSLFPPVPQLSSITSNFPMQKPVISGTISCSPLIQSSKVFGKYKVFKMEMRKTRLSKSPVTVCYPGKGQHELTASMDPSRGTVWRLQRQRWKPNARGWFQGERSGRLRSCGYKAGQPETEKKLATCTEDVGQFPLLTRSSLESYLP